MPSDEISITPIPIEELPEETVFTEELDENKKPKKKTTKTRTFKKRGPDDDEYFQIQTIDEEGKEPISLIRVVSDENIADIIDISKLDDEKVLKHKQKPHKHKGKNTKKHNSNTQLAKTTQIYISFHNCFVIYLLFFNT